MFWQMLAACSPWSPVLAPPTPAPEPEPAKPRIGRPDRGSRAQVKAARKAARRGRQR